MAWRRTLINLHKDVGFFCLGLTVVYAVSGIAVNHRRHWDYNFSERSVRTNVGMPAALLGSERPADALPGVLARREQPQLVARLLETLGRTERPRRVFWRGPDRLSLFFGRGARDVVDYLPSTGIVEHEQRRPRWLFRQLNQLHLNEQQGGWTWIADAYAVLLLFLGCSGIVVVKGRRGLKGRGGWLLVAGIALPLVALLLLG